AQTNSTSDASKLLSSIRKSAFHPAPCVWIGPGNEIWLRFAEHPKAVDWQLKNRRGAGWRVFDGKEEEAAWEELRLRYQSLCAVVVRVIGLPATMHEI